MGLLSAGLFVGDLRHQPARLVSTTARRSRPRTSSSRSMRRRKRIRAPAFYYKNVVKAEKTGDNEVTFTFDVKGNRELPQIVGQLDVLLEEILGRHRPRRPAARPHEVDAGNPGRLRPLSRQELRRGPLDHLRARQGLLGQGPTGLQGAVELRRVQAHLLPRPHAGVRGIQVGQARLLDREHAPASGRRATTSPPSRRAG